MNDKVMILPDGSAAAMMSFPLPKDHWLYAYSGKYEPPPMPFRMGNDDPRRRQFNDAVRSAARYAIRAATMKGKEDDFDPDALVQNMVVGLLGYHTADGLDSSDDWANPRNIPKPFPSFSEPADVPPDSAWQPDDA